MPGVEKSFLHVNHSKYWTRQESLNVVKLERNLDQRQAIYTMVLNCFPTEFLLVVK